MLYSQITNGFFLPGDNVPDDAVEIADELHQQLINDQTETGKMIIPGPDGIPILVDRPELAPCPNVAGFVSAIKSEIGIVAAASITGSALMFSALQMGDLADASALIDNALTLNQITTEQHSAIKAAALTFHVPLTFS